MAPPSTVECVSTSLIYPWRKMAGNNRGLMVVPTCILNQSCCSSLRGICSGVLSPCSLAEHSLCLIPVFSSPFPSVLTGRGGYNLGCPAEVESWGCWPEVSTAGIGACWNACSMISGRAGRGAAAAAVTSPGPGSGIKAAPGPGGALGGGGVIIHYGEGAGHLCPYPAEIPFLSSVNSCAINIVLFPFWIQNLVQVRGSWANPSHELIYSYWSRCPCSPVTTA